MRHRVTVRVPVSQPETDEALVVCRACCPVCYRRGRNVTVGFAVEGHGLFPLTRRPRQEERDVGSAERNVDSISMLFWQVNVGACYISTSHFRPPIWQGSSTRMPEELERTRGPVTSCRYGHRLRVPGRDQIDRMLDRISGDVVFLPAARRASL